MADLDVNDSEREERKAFDEYIDENSADRTPTKSHKKKKKKKRKEGYGNATFEDSSGKEIPGFENMKFALPNESNKTSNKVAPIGTVTTFDIDRGTVASVKDKPALYSSKIPSTLEFHQLCVEKHHEQIRTILYGLSKEEAKALVNCYDRFRPLHMASRYAYAPGAMETVKLLIEFGADVNGEDIDKQIPLHHTSSVDFMKKEQGGDKNILPTAENSIVHYLQRQGANVNKLDKHGNAPLHTAIARNFDIIIRDFVLTPGIDLELPNSSGLRPLHLSAYVNNPYALKILLKEGAMQGNKDTNHRLPIHYLTWQTEATGLLEMLLDKAEQEGGMAKLRQALSSKDIDKKTPLFLAVEAKCVAVVNILLKRGAQIEETVENHGTISALHLAASAGDVDIVKTLLDYRADDEAANEDGDTALHMAAAKNHVQLVEMLVKRNKTLLKKRNAMNYSAVLTAARYGSSEALVQLLSMGSNVFDRTENKTLLRQAVDNGKDRTLEAILEFCLEKDILRLKIMTFADNAGDTPMHVAAKLGYIRCVRVMCQKRYAIPGLKSSWQNKKRQTPLHLAAIYGHVVIVKELLRSGYFDIEAEDENSRTPLECAAEASQNAVVQHLIKSHARLVQGDDNSTKLDLLHIAAMKGWNDVCSIVLDHGANINKTQHGDTPLHLSARNGHLQCIDLFIKRGADVTLVNNKQNCLEMAIQYSQRDAVKAMLESDMWYEMLYHATTDPVKGSRDTPMRKLIRYMPDMAGLALEKCTTTNEKPDGHEDFEITYNYELLDDLYVPYEDKVGDVYDKTTNQVLPTAVPYSKDNSIVNGNHPVKLMVDHNCAELLKSPLVASLLEHKWNTYGFYLYYFNMLMHAFFLAILTAFVIMTKAPYSFFDSNMANCTAESCSNIANHCLKGNEERDNDVAVLQYLLLVLSSLFLVREVFQLISTKREYIQFENVLDWTLHVCTILAVADITSCVKDHPYVRETWQWQLAAVALLSGWVQLMLSIRRVPRFGIFVVMLTDILLTFLRFLPVFALLVIGFGLTFSMLFGNQERFSKEQYSIVSTFIMMVGEMDFGDLFFGTGDARKGSDEYAETAVYYKSTSYLVFIVFVMCMTIITMNLLVGLAVDDIQAVQEQAELKRLAMRAELAMHIESILPKRVRRRFMVRCHTIRPNVKKSRLRKIYEQGETFFSSKEKPTPVTQQEEMMQDILRRMDSVLQRVERLENIEKNLILLVRGQHRAQLQAGTNKEIDKNKV